ncbi:class I SAM-dependent methyltransferase [Gordonia sp. (in: high G+C Gram-positive bacteria)]|uniref:class I SAM-dependent methyltransferase n=1 Tax=Gordonia sp. (in: high G+C Gram-positive bacteria) TaxID=84139 RepID=UPI0016BCEE50|nr:class I SAM-dependent methyltransferase [Gordonia sp. (in: high G+C Gram-positive bacteria)]NLG45205.1 class I SAM-dependent methyltransferase [Gordonia sp. (in: high G+C Gram-positive bacteria)]
MPSIAQRLMGNPAFSQIYERLWRPVFTRGFSLGGSSTADYDRALRTYLARPGDRMVLDVACGPGNYSHDAARGLSGDGQYVGIDFAASMVAQAQRSQRGDRVTYLRGDAHHLPFPEATFDTVVCLAALYLIPDPLPVLDEMARVVRPGGEIIIFTSVRASAAALPGAEAIAGLSGLRIFGRRELVGRLESLGMEHVEQTITGVGQYVHARRPQ